MSKEVKLLGVIAVLVIIAALVGASYYRSSVQNERVTTGNANKTNAAAEALVRSDSPTLGAADAPVTIVEFLDPECEACSAFNPVVKKILKDYDGKVRLVVRIMTFHPNSMQAATFTEVAGEQGKYWQAQELLFQRQNEWGLKHGAPPAPPAETKALFEKYAKELGLDAAKIDEAIAENRFTAKFERDKQDGQSLGVRQTPTIFVNGRRLQWLDEASLRFLIESELKN